MTKRKSFALGYSIVLNTIISFICMTFFGVASINIIIPTLSAVKGFDTATLLVFSTVGGLIGSVIAFFAGTWVIKKGPKIVLCVSAIFFGLVYVFLPLSPTLIIAGILVALNQMGCIFYCQMTVMTILGNWFPRKKGFVMGIASAFGCIATLVGLPLLNKLNIAYGLTTAMHVFAAFLILYGIVSLFWLKNTPAEAGLLPDNMPITPEEEKKLTGKVGEKSPWTPGEILSNRSLWFMMIGFGLVILSLAAVGVTMVPFLIQGGLEQTVAVTVVQFTGVAGIIGSIISGWIDQRTTPWLSSMIFMGLIVLSFVLMCFGGSAVTIIIGIYLLQFVGGGIGNNLYASYLMTKVGVKNFAAAYRIMLPVSSLIRALSTSVIALGLTVFGNYRGGYLIVGGCCIAATILIFAAGKKPELLRSEKKAGIAANDR